MEAGRQVGLLKRNGNPSYERGECQATAVKASAGQVRRVSVLGPLAWRVPAVPVVFWDRVLLRRRRLVALVVAVE
jgi:hypothetical protein